jgi:hypothetical protein
LERNETATSAARRIGMFEDMFERETGFKYYCLPGRHVDDISAGQTCAASGTLQL